MGKFCLYCLLSVVLDLFIVYVVEILMIIGVIYAIIATKAEPIPFTLIVECKHWGENHKVNASVVRSVYGVRSAEQANKSVIVTSSKFTRDARKFAEAQKELMTLWDIDDLLALIGKNYDGEI